MYEEVQDIMSATVKTGRISWFGCSLIFTPKRLIVVKSFDIKKMQFDFQFPKGKKGDICYLNGHYVDIQHLGEYVVKRLGNGMQDFILRKRLSDILPDIISVQSIRIPFEDTLNYDKNNYQIRYNDISRVEVKKLSKWKWPQTTEIKITTQEKEHKFITRKPVTSEHVINILNSTLPEKTDVK